MTPLRRLLGYFDRYKLPLLTGFLCVVGSAGFSLLKPAIVGSAVDVLTKSLTRESTLLTRTNPEAT